MTDLYFSFDTEDFTCNDSSDAVRDQAEILHSYGIRANFSVVGYLAREWVRNRRWDVLDALKNHSISLHSLGHSYHPTINEYTDIEDFKTAYHRVYAEEHEASGMVKAATGIDRFPSAMTPGNNYSYAALYCYADMGIPVFTGSFHDIPGKPGIHFCNAYHLDYYPTELEILFRDPKYSPDALLNELAGMRQVMLCNHPNRVLFKEFWDLYNYNGENLHEWGKWVEPPRYSEEEVRLYYTRLRELIERIKADERFRIGDIDRLAEKLVREESLRVVTKDMLPAIRKNLEKELLWMNDPAELSVADCFFAARHFMDSDVPYKPGKVHGFLYEPCGITESVTLNADQVRRMAKDCDPADFLPPSFTADGITVGPADLLFAMLAVAEGEEKVTLMPRAQQCDLSRLPWVSKVRFENTWLFSPDFKDRYLSDRLRLQAWTARVERNKSLRDL